MKKTLITLVIIISNVAYAQNIGINSTGAAPAASAMLDIDASPGNNKGLLVPRIPLIATTNAAPVTAPATSLMVYNTATAGSGSTAVVPGYYYWDGSKWVKLTTSAWETNGNTGTIAGTHFIGTTDAQDVVVKTNATEKMRITSVGDVGIGTATPAQKLDVNGVGQFSGATLIGSGILQGFYGDGSNLALRAYNSVSSDLCFQTYGGATTNMIIKNNGNVGIGTAAPGAQLEVALTNNTTANSIARFSRTGTGSAGWFSLFSGASAADWNGMTQAGDKSFIFTNDNNPSLSANSGLIIAPWATVGNPAINSGIKIMENGNIGISVGAPTKKLEITSDVNAAIYGTRNFNGIANSDAGFIGGIDATYTNTGVYFVQKDNIGLGSIGTNLMNVVSNGVTKVLVNGTGNMRIGSQYYPSQCGGAVTATDMTNVKLAVMGGYSAFGGFNGDPIANPAPETSWINGVGALVIGMNRIPGTSNVDFWNVTDPGNGTAAITSTDRGFNWRNFNSVAGACNENSLMTLNGLGNLTISGTNYFTSDRRLKTDVKSFENSTLDKMMKLQPSVYQKHSSGIDASGNIVVHQTDEPINDFGFIAQDVYTVFPELVYKPKNETKELWAVDYARLSVMLTKAMQEQQQVIQSQEERIQKLEKR